MSSNNWYFHRGMLGELVGQTAHHTTTNSHLHSITQHLTQYGNGSGTSHGVMLDSCSSSLNDMKQHTNLTASRLNNIQNHLTQNGDGTGTSHGVMLDSCSSSLNTIESNSTLTTSRLNNVQNKLSENTDGSGDTAGEMLKSCEIKLTGSQTSSGLADICELLLFNAQQTTQELTIATTSLGNTTTYNLQKYSKVSVIIKEELNTPAAGTGYAILEWSDNDDVFYSGFRMSFTERFRADNSTSLGIFCNFDAVDVVAKYLRVGIYNSDGDTHRYDVDVLFLH